MEKKRSGRTNGAFTVPIRFVLWQPSSLYKRNMRYPFFVKSETDEWIAFYNSISQICNKFFTLSWNKSWSCQLIVSLFLICNEKKKKLSGDLHLLFCHLEKDKNTLEEANFMCHAKYKLVNWIYWNMFTTVLRSSSPTQIAGTIINGDSRLHFGKVPLHVIVMPTYQPSRRSIFFHVLDNHSNCAASKFEGFPITEGSFTQSKNNANTSLELEKKFFVFPKLFFEGVHQSDERFWHKKRQKRIKQHEDLLKLIFGKVIFY